MEAAVLLLSVAVLALSFVTMSTCRRLRSLENLAGAAAERLGELQHE